MAKKKINGFPPNYQELEWQPYLRTEPLSFDPPQGITVEYWEREKSWTGSYELDGTRIIKTFRVKWEDFQRFRADVLGWSTTLNASATERYLIRKLPYACPEHNLGISDLRSYGDRFLFATKINSVTPMGRYNTYELRILDRQAVAQPEPIREYINRYDFVEVAVQFEAMYYPVIFGLHRQPRQIIPATDTQPLQYQGWTEHLRYCFKREEPTSRVLTLERGTLVWDRGVPFEIQSRGRFGDYVEPAIDQNNADAAPISGTDASYGLNVTEPGAKVTWTWYDVPEGAFDPVKFQQAAGKINWLPLEQYPSGTLLMESPPKRTPRKTPLGTISYEIAFEFNFNPNHWNRFRAANNKFYFLNAKGAGGSDGKIRPYQYANFEKLFTSELDPFILSEGILQ